MKVLVAQSCLTMCDPMNYSLPGSSVHVIFQARTLQWVATSFSNAWKWKVKVKSLSHVRLLATPWAAAYQAPPSMGFSRQEYWSGVPLPSLMGKLSILPTYHLELPPHFWSLDCYSQSLCRGSGSGEKLFSGLFEHESFQVHAQGLSHYLYMGFLLFKSYLYCLVHERQKRETGRQNNLI